MFKSSLIDILRVLSEDEMSKLDDFVNSPYHNKIANVKKLYALIKKHYPDFDNENLQKEKVWAKLFPQKKYNYGTMKNLIHELTQLAEQFLITEESGKNEFRKYYELIDILFERGVVNVFESKLSSMDRVIKKYFLNNEINTIEEDFFILFNIYGVKLSSLHQLRGKFDDKKDPDTMSELMIFCFLIYCFKLHCNLNVFSEKEKGSNVKKNILQSFLGVLDKKDPEKIFEMNSEEKHFQIMKAYFKMFNTIGSNNSPENYHALKESVSDISKFARGHYTFDLFINLQNSLFTLKTGSTDFSKESYDIYNMRIESKNLLSENGVLNEIIFLQYVVCAFELKETGDIRKFTDMFLGKVRATSKETCKNFSAAFVTFLESDHNRSLDHIALINTDIPTIKLCLKDLQIMNYYELNDYESFLYASDSYKHFIKYKNNPKLLKKYDYRFCLIMKKLFELRSQPDQFELKKLKNENYYGLNWNKKWIGEKIDSLIG